MQQTITNSVFSSVHSYARFIVDSMHCTVIWTISLSRIEVLVLLLVSFSLLLCVLV